MKRLPLLACLAWAVTASAQVPSHVPTDGLVAWYGLESDALDGSGNGQMTTIQFKNNTPAKQFTMEMMGMTGLSMGELNKSAHARLKRNSSNSSEETVQEQKKPSGSSGCGIVLRDYSCSWSKYLEANPGPRAWAEANPDLVPAEKARLNARD